jgi:hypothetical protein
MTCAQGRHAAARAPLRIVGEATGCEPHAPERLEEMNEVLAWMEADGDMTIIE